MRTTLDTLKIQDVGIVIAMNDNFVYQKMMSLGLKPFSTVEVMQRSLLGGTILIKYGRSMAALRQDEAKSIVIELSN